MAFLRGAALVAEGRLNARNWARSPAAKIVTKGSLLGRLEERWTIPVKELPKKNSDNRKFPFC